MNRLHTYSSAIQHGLITINLFKQRNDQSRMKSNLQNAYKILGDIYFTKSLSKTESRYSDYENAHKFYKLEKEMIDSMVLSDIEDPEQDDLKRLEQSSHFNLGVMGSKIPSLYTQAEKNLQAAITLAHKLEDFSAERSGWWELGNLYKRAGQHDNVKFCQNEEFNVTKKHGFKQDQFYCFQEKSKYNESICLNHTMELIVFYTLVKFLLYLEEYDECFQYYEKTIGSISSIYIKQCVN